MNKVSFIIPARNEPYLTKTVESIFEHCSKDIEVIAALENYWPENWDAVAERYPGKLITVHHGQPHGMRSSINQMAAIASGDYLCKLDAHVKVSPEFDAILKRDCPSKTVMVPRRYRLDPEKWEIIEDGRLPVDYEYLSPPDSNGGGLKGRVWEQRARDRKDILIDPVMLTQGSAWFMPRAYFYELDLLDEANYGSFFKEMLEIGLKAWLSGGQVLTHKGVHYSHWHKPKRGYSMPSEEEQKAQAFSKKWLDDSTGWKKQTLPFATLLERFQPPGWENWKGTK